MTISEFWRSTFFTTRVALVCVAVAAVLNLGSYAGLGMMWAGGVFAILHLAIMALGFALFGRTARHHTLAWRDGDTQPRNTPLPRRLVWTTVIALVYLLVNFIVLAGIYGEGDAEVRNGQEVWVHRDTVVRTLPRGSVAAFDAGMLRVFSAVWIFAGLMIALSNHRVEERIRAYRSARDER